MFAILNESGRRWIEGSSKQEQDMWKSEEAIGEEMTNGNEEKFAELLLYVATRTANDPTVGSVKLNKLLYFAEILVRSA